MEKIETSGEQKGSNVYQLFYFKMKFFRKGQYPVRFLRFFIQFDLGIWYINLEILVDKRVSIWMKKTSRSMKRFIRLVIFYQFCTFSQK